MKITKYTHSCLLVEEQDTRILIDPGTYSTDPGLLRSSELPDIDYVLITHIHADHLDAEWLQDALSKLGPARVIGNPSVARELEKVGIEASGELPEYVVKHEWTHEELPFGLEAPPNWGFTLFDQLTHPGDCLHFDSTARVLALPMQAPFAHLKQATDYAVKMRPEVVIPIHDWHWREEARDSFYTKSHQFFERHNIQFIKVEDGQTFTV